MGNRKSQNKKILTFPTYRCAALSQNFKRISSRRAMSFFDSEVVRAEMAEISDLQEEVYSNVFKFPAMSRDEKLEHVKLLERLLNKQKVLYTRMSLSDDPEAKEMKGRIVDSAVMMGMPQGTDMNIILNNMSKMLEVMKEQIDKTGSDL